MAYDDELVPAKTLAEKASRPYPNDSAEYRAARTALLTEEIELRRHIERVAAMRRTLPPGGEVPEDYVFTGEDGQPIRLSQMFGDRKTLVVYTWMYGPQRKRPCPMCTAFLGALDGEARDIEQQVPLAIVGRAPIERQLEFKAERGWTGLRLFSTDGNAFTRDYRGEGPDGEDWAAFNVFTKDPDGTVRHFWGGEMDGSTADPGQDPRGAPEVMPMWTIFDMTPEGRHPTWYPKLAYPEDPKA
jgi:predicted dithiol-disulfide oxidoreductase (DUF899 family)